MGTIDSRRIIDEIIDAEGWDDPEWGSPLRVIKIVEYENFEGKTVWGTVHNTDSARMQIRYEIPTEYVNNPRIIWTVPPE